MSSTSKASLTAAIAEPIGEPARRERCTTRGHQECQIITRHRRQHTHQLWVHRDHQRDVRLFLPYCDPAVLDVLPTHLDDVADALPGIDRQREGEPLLASDRVDGLELRDLDLAPGMEPLAAVWIAFHAERRIALNHANLDTVVE